MFRLVPNIQKVFAQQKILIQSPLRYNFILLVKIVRASARTLARISVEILV